MKQVILIVLILSVFSNNARCQGVVPDSTFGTFGFANGGQPTQPGLRDGAMAVQADNKIINVQTVGTIDTTYVALTRSLPDGSPDNSFGIGGVALTVFPINEIPLGVALQADGKILVCGIAYAGGSAYYGSVCRFNTNGSPDSTFGVNGVYKSYFPGASTNSFTALAVLGNGEIIASGNERYTAINRTGIVKLQTNGTLDSTFGVNGRVTGDTMTANSLAIQSDGKIVIGGSKGNMAIARYLANGNTDPGFGTNGIVNSNYKPATGSWALGVFVLPDGHITGAGGLLGSNQLLTQYMAMQVDSNGIINAQYGNNGAAVDSTPAYFISMPSAAAIQADGKVIIAGSIAVDSADYDRFGMVRFNANGTVDAGFGNAGVVVATQSGKAYCTAIAVQPDSKILLGGGIEFGTDSFTMGVARFGAGTVNSVENIKLSRALTIFPNPTNSQINLWTEQAGNYTLFIYNELGEEMLMQKISFASNQYFNLDVQSFSAGIYRVKLKGEAGNQFGTFVKR